MHEPETPQPEQRDWWLNELARRRLHLTALDDEMIMLRYPPRDWALCRRLRNYGFYCLLLDERAAGLVRSGS